jgi:hypothetical protein
MRIFSEGKSGQRAARKGFFARLLNAVHRSRRRDTIRVLRRYRHLIAGQAQIRPAIRLPESRPANNSGRNAVVDDTLARAIRQARRRASSDFA